MSVVVLELLPFAGCHRSGRGNDSVEISSEGKQSSLAAVEFHSGRHVMMGVVPAHFEARLAVCIADLPPRSVDAVKTSCECLSVRRGTFEGQVLLEFRVVNPNPPASPQDLAIQVELLSRDNAITKMTVETTLGSETVDFHDMGTAKSASCYGGAYVLTGIH